jgi:hypothetical protein
LVSSDAGIPRGTEKIKKGIMALSATPAGLLFNR